jgi:hypothetical protein
MNKSMVPRTAPLTKEKKLKLKKNEQVKSLADCATHKSKEIK